MSKSPQSPQPSSQRHSVKRFRLSRRALLRAGGISLALPWLEAMAPDRAFAQPAGAASRVLFVYFPSGYRKGDWVPTGTGTTFTLPAPALALAPLQKKLTLITGLANKPASVGSGGAGIHARGTGCFLICNTLQQGGFLGDGISLDQVIAKQIGTNTCLPSLVLGLPNEQPPTFSEDGYGAVYYNNISFTGPKSNVQKVTKPADLFMRLVTCPGLGTGGEAPPSMGNMPAPVDQRAVFEKTVMGQVKTEAQKIMNCAGQADRLRLEEYFTSISELERRFLGTAGGGMGGPGPIAASCTKPAAAPVAGTSLKEAATAMIDLALLAYKCGLTRVGTLMMDGAFSHRNYGLTDIGGVNYIHGLSHGEVGGRASDHPRWAKITAHYFEMFAYLLGKMDATNEGAGTMLDNSIVYIGSEFGDGDAHQFSAQPVIIAGGGGGRLKMGQHIVAPPNTPTANALLDVANAMGIASTSFGDSTGKIAGLSA